MVTGHSLTHTWTEGSVSAHLVVSSNKRPGLALLDPSFNGNVLAGVNVQPAAIDHCLSNGPPLNKRCAPAGVAEEKPRPQMLSC